MPRPEHIGLAELLLRKAEADLAAARALALDIGQHDEAVGFHAQQAVEKAMKAALASARVPAPRTHDLAFLIELLDTQQIPMPTPLAESDWLSPWAVTTRYDDVDEQLDGAAALDIARVAINWAQSVVGDWT